MGGYFRRIDRVERAKWEGERQREQAQGSEGAESRPLPQPFRQLGIPPLAEKEVQERASRRIRGEGRGLSRGAERWQI